MSHPATGNGPQGETVLIAAFSGRALAQSARRAGFLPLVVDCFGDLDMRQSAWAWRCLPARVQVGFLRRPLIAALQELANEAPSPPFGLVLGAGFECNPKLVAALAELFPLIGNDAGTIRRVKDPTEFFGTLATLGIRHPETCIAAPPTPEGWLMKRIGGSGGLHIHHCPAAPRPDPRRYFQRRATGTALSMLGVVSDAGAAFAPSLQWVSPRERRPYRYGGAATGLKLGADLETLVVDTALAVTRQFGLKGLVSFDFLISPEGEPLLLEVNPRPGASIDVLDDVSGTLFAAHIKACQGANPAPLMQKSWRPPEARAAAYLYADDGALNAPALEWPDWTADRPPPGTAISRGQPLATVIAEGRDADEATARCRDRLGILTRLVYDAQKNGKEPTA